MQQRNVSSLVLFLVAVALALGAIWASAAGAVALDKFLGLAALAVVLRLIFSGQDQRLAALSDPVETSPEESVPISRLADLSQAGPGNHFYQGASLHPFTRARASHGVRPRPRNTEPASSEAI